MPYDLIFTQIYPMINYFFVKFEFSSIFWDKKDTIKVSKTTKIFILIFLPTPAPFILFLLFLDRFWRVTHKLGLTVLIKAVIIFQIITILINTLEITRKMKGLFNVVMVVITQFLGYYQNLSKNNKNKIKEVSVVRKINVKILVVSASPIVSLLSVKKEESTDLRQK